MNFNGGSNARTRAMAMAALRAFICVYLIYLGGKLIYDHVKGESEMAPWMVWFFGILFILAGLAFGIYTWKRYQKDKQEPPEEPSEETPQEPQENAPEEPSENHMEEHEK